MMHKGGSAPTQLHFYLSHKLRMFLVLFFSLFIAFCIVRLSGDLFLYFERMRFYDVTSVQISDCTLEFLICNY